jgi:BatD DUF11 like domain
MKMPFRTTLTAALLALLVCIAPRLAAQEATAGLSSPTTYVGQPVEIVVTVRDVRSAEPPSTVDVPGLSIQLFGRQTRFEMNNFKITSSLTFTYSVTPTQAGEFDIPPFEVRVGDRTLKTNPLRLTVADGALAAPPPQLQPGMPPQQFQPPPGQQQPGQPQTGGIPYFGELVLSKRKAYTGEVVPAELRYYFNSSIGGEVGDRPTFSGEGFTVQKFANTPKREQIVNGENYVVFSFQTAITPAKSGMLEIPAAKLEARLQLPGSAPPGFEDFFRNFGGAMPPGMFTNAREVAVETRPATLEVVPLPKDGRPDDFGGAIGKFEMEAAVSPKKAGPGDPVTLRVTISGQGNFEAMGAPVLTDDEGWRTYPPTEKFEPTDQVNFVGSKTYEFSLVAREDREKTPGVRFAFLDPDTGKYELLTQEPFAIQASAGQAPATEPADSETTPAKTATATPTPTPAPKPASSESAAGSSSWTSLLQSPAFLLANALAAAAWIGTLAYILIRRSANSPAGLRRSRKKRLRTKLAALSSAPDADFYRLAAECLHTALDTESSPLDASACLEEAVQDPATRQTLQEILSRDAESKYSASGTSAPDPAARQRIVQALEKIP